MKQRTGRRGFTLVELLVAATIMVLILSALGSLFISTSRAYRVNDELSERQQSADAAAQLLSYEIGLAGYRGSTSDAAKDSTKFAATESTLSIVKGTSANAPDTITVRYWEDRFTSPTKIAVTFSAAKDSNNVFNLYRHNHTDTSKTSKQPAIQNVQNLKVLGYIRKDGSEGSTTTADNLTALRLELTFSDGLKKQVVIGVNNPQQAPILPTL